MSVPTVRDDSWSMYDAFDADVGVTVAETGLYLVAAHDDADGAVAMRRALLGVGAQLVASISKHKVLALVAFAGFQTLRSHPAIRVIGPVALDANRFSHFQRLIGAGAD